MPNENTKSLELDAVIQRFAESADTLALLREQLQDLKRLREAEMKANDSLQEASGQVSGFATEAARILFALEDALGTATEVLRVGSALLDGTELKTIADTVSANSESISGVQGRVDTLQASVTELTDLVRTLQNTVEQGIQDLKDHIQRVHDDVKTPIIVKRFF